MKILIIPDVHLKPWIFDEADKVNTKRYDNIVCLGDLVDDWDQQYNTDLYEKTLQRVLRFDKEHPNMFWCLGNHDFSYLWGHPETGYSSMQGGLVSRYIIKLDEQADSRLGVVHNIDGVLFSHAGLTKDYASKYFKDTADDPEKTIKEINSAWRDKYYEEKLWTEFSPIWLRPPAYQKITAPYLYNQTKEDFKVKQICQVVGHTPVKKPTECYGMLIYDTFSTYSDGRTPIGNERLIIFDTNTREWEYV